VDTRPHHRGDPRVGGQIWRAAHDGLLGPLAGDASRRRSRNGAVGGGPLAVVHVGDQTVRVVEPCDRGGRVHAESAESAWSPKANGVTDPVTVQDNLELATAELDACSKALTDAVTSLDEAEDSWLKLFDETAQALKEEMVEEGRKGDPAEHVVTSVARRKDRLVYKRWRDARRQVDLLEKVSANRRSQLSGYQSQLKALDSEAGVQDHLGQRTNQLKGPRAA